MKSNNLVSKHVFDEAKQNLLIEIQDVVRAVESRNGKKGMAIIGDFLKELSSSVKKYKHSNNHFFKIYSLTALLSEIENKCIKHAPKQPLHKVIKEWMQNSSYKGILDMHADTSGIKSLFSSYRKTNTRNLLEKYMEVPISDRHHAERILKNTMGGKF